MKNYSLALSLAVFLFSSLILAKPANTVFALFARPHAEVLAKTKAEKAKQQKGNRRAKVKTPTPNAGIFATYMGYINLTDKNGQLTFPRQGQRDIFNILVTTDVEPVFLNKGTISYWNLNKPAQLYSMERKQDKSAGIYFWQAKEEELPKDKKIPLHTIIILASPRNIYIPTGITPTGKGTQLVLPDIYAREETENFSNDLMVTKIRQFYSPILTIWERIPNGYQNLIKPLT